MSPFWKIAGELWTERLTLAAALVFAAISASGLGAGLLAVVPLLDLLLGEEGTSLRLLAETHNAGQPWLVIPDVVVSALPTDRYQGFVWILVGLLVLTVLGGLANFLHQYLAQSMATRAVGRIRLRVFERVVAMPLRRVVSWGPSALVARIIRDSAELKTGFIALTSKTITHVLKGLIAFGVAMVLDWKLTLAAAVGIPVLYTVLRKLAKRVRRGTREALRAQEGLLRVSTESLQGLRAVKSSTAEAAAIDRFAVINDRAIHQELRVRTARAASSPLMESLTMVVVAMVALVAARFIISDPTLIKRFIATLTALAMAGVSFRPLAAFVNQVHSAAAPAKRILEVLEEPEEESSTAKLPTLPRHHRSLEFDRVSLTYDGAEQPALADVTLNVLHGERVAIVGPNGSGKTTLISMVPRLLVPDSGQIRIDGTDIATVSLRSLREQVGVVTQEAVLIRASVTENIQFGRTEATSAQVIDAARRAHAHEFIEQIPGGYEANVLEQGASLSGGQRQRLAIARAILRDPAILILDEATSQIDAESEASINAAIAEFCGGRTSLIVAHRLSTVLEADRIVVMDAGRIVDQGTHDQLLARCEVYVRLSRTQLVGSA